MRRSLISLLWLVLLPAAMVACVPGLTDDRGPRAVVLGVPADRLVPGAADELQLRLDPDVTGHELVSTTRARFLEVRRGLVDGMVAPGAARIARNTGADVAVTIRASTLVREIVDADRPRPWQRTVLQLEIVLLDATDASELARLAGPRLQHERRLNEATLPDLADDPAVATLRDRGLDDLAPRVAQELRSLAVLTGSTGE